MRTVRLPTALHSAGRTGPACPQRQYPRGLVEARAGRGREGAGGAVASDLHASRPPCADPHGMNTGFNRERRFWADAKRIRLAAVERWRCGG